MNDLFWAVLGNRIARCLLGLHIVARCRAMGLDFDPTAAAYEQIDDGILVTMDGEPLGWFPYSELIPDYPGAR